MSPEKRGRPKGRKMTGYHAVRLTPALSAALQRAAADDNNTEAAVIRRVLSAGLTRELRAALAEQRSVPAKPDEAA